MMLHRVSDLSLQADEDLASQLRRMLPDLVTDSPRFALVVAAKRVGLATRTLNRRLAALDIEPVTGSGARNPVRHRRSFKGTRSAGSTRSALLWDMRTQAHSRVRFAYGRARPRLNGVR